MRRYSTLTRSSEMSRVEFGPVAVEPGQRREMLLIVEARHAIIRLRIEMRAVEPVLRDQPEQRQLRLTLLRRGEGARQMMHQARDEHRLAGARQPGHAEPQARAGEVILEAFRGDAGLEQEIGKLRHGVGLGDR